MLANLPVIENDCAWILASAYLIGNGNREDSTVGEIHLFSYLHHSRSRAENNACYDTKGVFRDRIEKGVKDIDSVVITANIRHHTPVVATDMKNLDKFTFGYIK